MITNLVAKVLTLLLVSAVIWGGIVAAIAFALFGAVINVIWLAGLAVSGGLLFCMLLLGIEFYQSIDPAELQDDEGNEFLEALMLGHQEF